MKTTLLKQLKTFYLPSDKENRDQNRDDKLASAAGSFYNRIEEELNKIDRKFEWYVQQFINKNSYSYAAKLIKSLKTPLLKIESTEDERKKWLKDHFWDRVDFADATLLHSPVISSKVLEYIALYKDNRLHKEEQEMAIIEAVDVILFEAGDNEEVFDFVLDFLTRKFEKSEYELVLTYITENYVLADSSCEKSDEEILSDRAVELKDKVDKIKSLAVGKKAPEIYMSMEGVVDLKGSAGSLVTAG